MRIEAFRPAHVAGVHAAPARFRDLFDPGFVAVIARHPTWSVIDGEGASARTVFVGGVVPRGDGLAAWGAFTEHARPHHVLAVHRMVKAVLADLASDADTDTGAIVIDLDPAYPQGLRWARMLGFEVNP